MCSSLRQSGFGQKGRSCVLLFACHACSTCKSSLAGNKGLGLKESLREIWEPRQVGESEISLGKCVVRKTAIDRILG